MLLLLLAIALSRSATPPGPVDVSTLTIGAPTLVQELDLGKLKGELREVSWSPDGLRLYIGTADGEPSAPRLRHYSVAASGGPIEALEARPDWAAAFWEFKSDRAAPGIGSTLIDMTQTLENVKYGTGSAGAIEGGERIGGGTVMSGANIDRANQQQKQNVVRLTVYGEAISEFVNQRPIPGLMFGWGPERSGAIAYTTPDGRLVLLDAERHKQVVHVAKDALLPAWSRDGSRLAWVQKTGRRRFALMWAPVEQRER